MISQPLVLPLLLAASHGVAANSSSLRRHIPRPPSSQAAAVDSATSSSSEEDTSNLAETRTRSLLLATNEIPQDCLNLLAVSANENGALRKENYFVFTDGMANGYYSFQNMTSYGELPMNNKFGFVTLSCQCHAHGGRPNCCQGERAHLDVKSGIDDPDSMSEEMHSFIVDICSVTSDSIGDDKMPPTGELPTTAQPSFAPVLSSNSPTISPSVVSILMSPTNSPNKSPTPAPTDTPATTSLYPTYDPWATLEPKSLEPTTSPTEEDVPAIIITPPAGVRVKNNDGANDETEGAGQLSVGAWTGITIAGAAACFLLPLMLYLFSKRCRIWLDDEKECGNLDDSMTKRDNQKELPTLTYGELNPDVIPRHNVDSPNGTTAMNSVTASEEYDFADFSVRNIVLNNSY